MTESIQDPHHCYCFRIKDEYNYDLFRDGLEKLDFNEPFFQENHEQIFGLTKRLDEFTQIHIKLLEDGTIEGEMEYPPDYPIAHLNQKHSYSAHKEIKIVLKHIQISYSHKWIPPFTCIRRKIIKAIDPTSTKTIIVGLVVSSIMVGLLYYLTKEKKS